MPLLRSILCSSGSNSNDKGWFVDPASLNAAYPTGQNGWYAIVGSTDTVWVWDSDTNAWVDSGESAMGNVVGPANAADNEIVLFNGTTGESIKGAGATYGDMASQSANNVSISGGNLDNVNIDNSSLDAPQINNPTFTQPITTQYGGTGQDFSASNGVIKLTAGVSSVVNAPSGNIVGDSDTQTLTNKTIDAASNTISNLPTFSQNTNGQVPGPTGGDIANNRILRADGTWVADSQGSGTVTSITAGTGLDGGTITTSGTIDLADTAVTPGGYSNPSIIVDSQGRITYAENGPSALTTVSVAGSGTITVPSGAYQARIMAIGAGSGGGGGGVSFDDIASGYQGSGGGGGSAGEVQEVSVPVKPGMLFDYTVGSGGIGGSGATQVSVATSGADGTATTIKYNGASVNLLSALGGTANSNAAPRNGGGYDIDGGNGGNGYAGGGGGMRGNYLPGPIWGTNGLGGSGSAPGGDGQDATDSISGAGGINLSNGVNNAGTGAGGGGGGANGGNGGNQDVGQDGTRGCGGGGGAGGNATGGLGQDGYDGGNGGDGYIQIVWFYE